MLYFEAQKQLIYSCVDDKMLIAKLALQLAFVVLYFQIELLFQNSIIYKFSHLMMIYIQITDFVY